jgi:uncharacterized protein YqeY
LLRQLEASEIEAAAKMIIATTGASGLKDMGTVMAGLAGVIDFGVAGRIVKRLLG